MKKFFLYFTIFIVFLCMLFFCFWVHKQIHKSEKVEIVFTTDINYKDYLKVAINSAIKNKNRDTKYNINIVGVDLDKNNLNEYKSFETENVKINLVPVSLKMLDGIGMYKIKYHVTRADLFKFIVPDLFPALDKILYIDADTVILKDLSDLYNTDIGNKYIGVVHKSDPKYIWKKHLWHWKHYLQPDYNCGVILYNLKMWRKNNIKNLLIEQKNRDKNRKLMTQSSFNNVLDSDKVYYISPVYNFLSQWNSKMFERNQFKKIYKPYLNKINSFEELYNQAVIIHYADKDKPWNSHVNYSQLWWRYKE